MRLRWSQLLLYATLLALVLGGGVANGLVNGRWASAAEEGAPQLERLPLTLGDWDGTAIEADPDQFPPEESGNMLLRRYARRGDAAAVVVYLTVGRAGRIVSAHLPDSCYPSAGHEFAAPLTKRSIPVGPEGRTQEFHSATFSKTERALPMHQRIYWSWSATGDWRVPDYPRLAFAGQRWVYKLYVIRQLARVSEPLNEDAAEEFLQILTPEIDKVFFANPAESTRSDSGRAK